MFLKMLQNLICSDAFGYDVDKCGKENKVYEYQKSSTSSIGSLLPINYLEAWG